MQDCVQNQADALTKNTQTLLCDIYGGKGTYFAITIFTVLHCDSDES